MPHQASLLLTGFTLAALCAGAQAIRTRARVPTVLAAYAVASIALDACRPHSSPAIDGLLFTTQLAAIPTAAEIAWPRQGREPLAPIAAVLFGCAQLLRPELRAWLVWLPVPVAVYAASRWPGVRASGWASVALAGVIATELVGTAARWSDPSPDGYLLQAVIWSLAMLAVSALCVAGAVRGEA